MERRKPNDASRPGRGEWEFFTKEHTMNTAHKDIQKSHFGTTRGVEISLYTLTNANGVICKIANYGGTITELHVPDRNGRLADVVLGYDDLKGYETGKCYFGALIGRVANRIAGSRFTLDGQSYQLPANEGPNHLHGGIPGFDKVAWNAEPVVTESGAALRLTYTSPDGDQGYPGTLKVSAVYTLTDANELRLDFEATTDKPTPVNLTNHTYWNLAGAGKILDHILTLAADRFTPTDAKLIPTGEIKSVKGTPMDFTSPHSIGSRLDQLPNNPPGYDDNFALNSGGGKLAFAARAHEPASGRVLEVWSDQPAVQLYTGNYLSGFKGKRGAIYERYGGFCLEPQYFPDFVHHPQFAQSILRPGETYRQSMVCRFSAR